MQLVRFISLHPMKQLNSMMRKSSEKSLKTSEDSEQALSQTCSGPGLKPLENTCLWKTGVATLITGVGLILVGVIGALHLWKESGKQVISVHYSMSINGKPADASMEIDTENNLERFRTGSGDGQAVQVHDFQVGITATWFSREDKCYIKSQAKTKLQELKTPYKDSLMSELEDVMPVKMDEEPLVWVASQEPLKDKSFLGSQILNLCGNLPIYWLRPTLSKRRKRRNVRRLKRQYETEEFDDGRGHMLNATTSVGPVVEERSEEGSSGSAYNPDNPYHSRQDSEVGNMIFDPMLDHRGICCSECQRSHTHCERICEPLGGYWPWPYNYRGCRVACRLIMPCRWWAARMLGLV